jgi:hypothetical protein
LQRALHRETQMIFLCLTRRLEIALALFSLLFLPGVFLHECSHYLMALLLRVRTGRISLLPRALEGGRLQLGFVETAPTDWLRDALIGLAPLLAGGAFVAYASLARLGLNTLWEQFLAGGLQASIQALPDLYSRPDFWTWFYLVFVVSSTMLPSPSDRRAWLPLGLIILLLLGLSWLAGAGSWLWENLAPPLNQVLLALDGVCAVSGLVHLVLLPPLFSIRILLFRLTGMQPA